MKINKNVNGQSFKFILPGVSEGRAPELRKEFTILIEIGDGKYKRIKSLYTYLMNFLARIGPKYNTLFENSLRPWGSLQGAPRTLANFCDFS